MTISNYIYKSIYFFGGSYIGAAFFDWTYNLYYKNRNINSKNKMNSKYLITTIVIFGIGTCYLLN